MGSTRAWLSFALLLGCTRADDASPAADPNDLNPPETIPTTAPWLSGVQRLVAGPDDLYLDCRSVICRHNENTDLVSWRGALWLVHRTAISQVLGPNSSLHIYRSTDEGAHFVETASIDAPSTRDIRDPHFYVVGDRLHVKALTRLPVTSARDSNVDTIAIEMHSDDGATWSEPAPIGPVAQSFWRIKEHGGAFYSASYEDGDRAVTLFSSTDGVAWAKGSTIYGISEDTPLETELLFTPSGKMLALVRMDGTDRELLGDEGRLRTKVCVADAPYATFDCSHELTGQRLDGPIAFFVGPRLFVVARKHLQGTGKKRTSLFELTGDLEKGELVITEKGELPSAGDTSYAGIAFHADGRALVTWYSGRLDKDDYWLLGMGSATNIWQADIDFARVP